MDMEETFGIRKYAIREVFWENPETFTDKHGHRVTNPKTEMMMQRASLYAVFGKEKDPPL